MTDIKAKRPERTPTHPGEIVAEDILPALDLTVTAAAKALGVSRNMLYKIINAESGITPEMALRIGKLAGNGPDIWLRMQNAYDLWHANRKLAKDLAKIPAPPAPKRAARGTDRAQRG